MRRSLATHRLIWLAMLPWTLRPRTIRGWLKATVFLSLLSLTAWLLYDRIGRPILLEREIASATRALVDTPQQGRLLLDTESPETDHKRRDDAPPVGDGEVLDELGRSLPFKAMDSSIEQRLAGVRRLLARQRRMDELRIMPDLLAAASRGGGIFGSGAASGWHPTLSHTALAVERRATSGDRRIVLVALTMDPSSESAVGFEATVIEPGGWWTQPRWKDSHPAILNPGTSSPTEIVIRASENRKGVRIYATALDPNDSSAFSLDFEYDDRRGTVTGRLQSDDSIQWTVKGWPPPATQAIQP